MAHSRYTVTVGERGRFVLPAQVRRSLDVHPGDVLVLDLDTDQETVRVRRAQELARTARGVFRGLAPGTDLASDLIHDRRREAARENDAAHA